MRCSIWYDSIIMRITSTILMLAAVPALLLLTVGCTVPTPACKTACGMTLLTPPGRSEEWAGQAWWTCEQLQRVEDTTIDTYQWLASPHDGRFDDSCAIVHGYTVEVQPTMAWKSSDGEDVAGQTFCESKVMLINRAPPMASSLTHEMGHAIQNCNPLGPFPTRDAGESDVHFQDRLDHANWDRDGIVATEQWVGMLANRDAQHCLFWADGGIASPDGYFDDAYSGPVPGYGPGDDYSKTCPGIPTH